MLLKFSLVHLTLISYYIYFINKDNTAKIKYSFTYT